MVYSFGDLFRQYCARKRGLSQARLAGLAGYGPAVLTRMMQGKKDLTGPSGRERVVRLIGVLGDEGVLTTLAEANALLAAAHMAPLFVGLPEEAALIGTLRAGNIPLDAAYPGVLVRHNLPTPLT